MSDMVNSPKHYTKGGIEVIDFIEAKGLGLHEGSIIQYVTRWREKNGIEDLRKAKWYIERLIQLEIARIENQLDEEEEAIITELVNRDNWTPPSAYEQMLYIQNLNKLSPDVIVVNTEVPTEDTFEPRAEQCSTCMRHIDGCLCDDDDEGWEDSYIPYDINGNKIVETYFDRQICDDPCSRDRCIGCVNDPETQQVPYVGIQFPSGWPYDKENPVSPCLSHECICPDKGGCK